MIHVKVTRFINAEPALLPGSDEETPTPAVIVSFGEEEGEIEDLAISVVEARQMVFDLIESLATMGDPMAQAIGNQFFAGGQDE